MVTRQEDKNMDLVAEFMNKFSQKIATRVFRMSNLGDQGQAVFRHKLMAEENQEFIEAVGMKDDVGVFDALCDMQYILDGTFLALGFANAKAAGMAEVHRANMSKLDKNGQPKFREDGKILKGENYVAPDLKSVLEKYLKDTLQSPL